MDEEEKGREGGRNRERERETDRKTGYENQAEILHYDESFAPTFSSLLTLNPLSLSIFGAHVFPHNLHVFVRM